MYGYYKFESHLLHLYKPFGLLVPTCFKLICFLFVLDNNHYYFPLTGIYVCSNCGNELFHSQTKYEHSSPWPAFTHLIREDSVTRVKESSTAIKVLLWWFCKPFSKFYNMCVLYYIVLQIRLWSARLLDYLVYPTVILFNL